MDLFQTAWGHILWPIPARMSGFATENHIQSISVFNNIEGDAIRFALSNLYGKEPLVFAAVSVDSDGEVVPVTVNGDKIILIPPGEEIFSDAVYIHVLPGEWITIHTRTQGRQVMRGFAMPFLPELARVEKQGFSESPFPVAGTPLDDQVFFYGLTAVQVKPASKTTTVAMFGDSITHMPHIYGPLVRRLYEKFTGTVGFTSAGITGNRVLHDGSPLIPMGDWFGPAGIKRFERDIFGIGSTDLVMVLEGINDICHPTLMGKPEETPAAGAIILGLSQLATIAHHRGSIVLACTLPPFGGYAMWNPELEKLRAEINGWIRGNNVYDGFLDFDTVLADPESSLKMAASMDLGDGLHPNRKAGVAISKSKAFEKLCAYI